MIVIASLILLVAAASLYCLIQMAADLRTIRNDMPSGLAGQLADIRAALQAQAEGVFRWGWGVTSHHQHSPAGFGCFVIWEWREGDWQAQHLPKGVDECWPPSYPGAFPGDIARTWVTLSRK